jgi:hypothetical protein
VKNFARQLDPQNDQLGFVAFASNVINAAGRRTKLQCLRAKTPPPSDVDACYSDVLAAAERQWPTTGTNIAEGMREGLEELGFNVGNNTGVDSTDSTCSGGIDDKHACNRSGIARPILVLITDGTPNTQVSNCSSQPGYADFWDGLVGANDPDFDCAMWYAQQAAARGVTVDTIGIGSGANADFLTTMASGVDPRSGGTPVAMFAGASGHYFPASKPTDLNLIFEVILEQHSCLASTYLPLILKNN